MRFSASGQIELIGRPGDGPIEQSWTLANLIPDGILHVQRPWLRAAAMETRRSRALIGSGRNSSALTSEKIAVLAPIPSAIDRIATALTMGAATSDRHARRRSCMRTSAATILQNVGEIKAPVDRRRATVHNHRGAAGTSP
jgi:hypothetical protein